MVWVELYFVATAKFESLWIKRYYTIKLEVHKSI